MRTLVAHRVVPAVAAAVVCWTWIGVSPVLADTIACGDKLGQQAVFPQFDGVDGARDVEDLRRQLGKAAGRKAWGLDENVTVDLEREWNAPILTVRLPKGSINPKNRAAPLGGMGWRWRPLDQARPRRACLTYRLRFADGFGFRRGGKLPGLFGGNAPAGGKHTNGSRGFSLRLMWRRRGAGEVYAYIPGHPKGRGTSLQRGAWFFELGRWSTIQQEVVLNDPGARNGTVRVWVDGTLRLEIVDLVIRTDADVGVSGVMGDVFYGGKDPSWASPTDTFVQFSAFRLQW